MGVKHTSEWMDAAGAALSEAGYSTSLHIAAIGEVAHGDIRIAFKSDIPKPWAVEVFRDRAAERFPDEHDVHAIARDISAQMASERRR
jgi:CO/xanthine dehydrogenase FAD-binding subunit